MLKLTQEMVPLKLSSSNAIQRHVPGRIYELRHPGWGILTDEPSRDLNLRIMPNSESMALRAALPYSASPPRKDQTPLGPCDPTQYTSCFPLAAGTEFTTCTFSEPSCRAWPLKKIPLDCSLSIIHWSKLGFPKLAPHHPPPIPQVLAESPGSSTVVTAKVTPSVHSLDDEGMSRQSQDQS